MNNIIMLIILIVVNTILTSSQYHNRSTVVPTIPIKVYRNQPFLLVSQLCSDDSYGRVSVMLDTGSSYFWLADNGCTNCKITGAFCPHINNLTTTVSYVKGQIIGSDSFLNLCRQQIKFLCIKKIISESLEYGHGIMGLRVGSVGSSFFQTQILNRFGLRQSSSFQYIFHLNGNQNFISFGYSSENLSDIILQQLQCDSQWSFNAESLLVTSSLNTQPQNMEIKQYKVSVDTGSSKIVLPYQICQNILKALGQHNIECISDEQGLNCNYRIDLGLRLKIKVGFQEQVLNISSQNLQDDVINSIHIVCLQQSFKGNKIILGYPLFRSYAIGFLPQQSKISIYRYKNQKPTIIKPVFFLLIYLAFLSISSYLVNQFIGYIQHKKSVKIII